MTWGAIDTLDQNSSNFVGGFGVTSGRPGNFAVQNADLLIAFGTRLDTHEVGPDIRKFGRAAKKVIVDIDESELNKYQTMGLQADLLINADVGDVIDALNERTDAIWPVQTEWLNQISKWKNNYPICLEEYYAEIGHVNPYVFMEALSSEMNEDAVLVSDCGSNIIWTMQGFKTKPSQRVITSLNHSPMGYSLPGVIGSFLADPLRQHVCITGDGGMQINVQELATIQRHQINVKIFIVNNHGHGIIQGTQDSWLESQHHASNPDQGGLPDPDFAQVARAYGLHSEEIYDQEDLNANIRKALDHNGPMVCVVHLKSGAFISPKLLFGRPIEDSSPLLPRDEFKANMLVPIIE